MATKIDICGRFACWRWRYEWGNLVLWNPFRLHYWSLSYSKNDPHDWAEIWIGPITIFVWPVDLRVRRIGS